MKSRLYHRYRPLIFDAHKADTHRRLERLLIDCPELEISDTLDESIEDLFKIDNPFIVAGTPEYRLTLKDFRRRYMGGLPADRLGVWCYYPWRSSLVHLPAEADYLRLRTARNMYLITPEEQQCLATASVAVAGLSVGLSAVNSLVLSGARRLRLADHDRLAATNLNRLLGSVCDLGREKIIVAARRVFELDPFADLTLYRRGLNSASLAEFLAPNGQAVSVLVEEMDDIKLKVLIRFTARQLRLPVVMATDNGDNAIIDIERFDLEPTRALFHGRMANAALEGIGDNLTQSDRVKLASQIVGSNITPRTQRSLMQVGTKLPSWPQLGNAATLSGVAVSYVVRRIVSGLPMPSGRYHLNLDANFDPDYASAKEVAERTSQSDSFIEALGVLFGVKVERE